MAEVTKAMTGQLGIFREIRLAAMAIALLIGIGTVGYVWLEGWSALDAFYMTVITVFTVGFREVGPLSPASQLFTTGLIVFGVGIALWAGASMLQLALSPEARVAIRRRRTRGEIAKMRDHYIICGYGRIGREVCATFLERGVPHAIGDMDDETASDLEELPCPYVQGDCTDDDVLRSLGIEHARGLIAVAGTDADNTFIVLSARALRPDLYIVARATTHDAERKLRAAGADRAITPYKIGGRRIAALAIQPGVVDFLDVMMKGDEADLALDEIPISPNSELVGRTLQDSRIRDISGAVVLAIRTSGAPLNSNPNRDAVLAADDMLIALGTCEQLAELSRMAGASGK